MKFMFMVKSDKVMGHSPKLMEAMQKLTQREIESGRMIGSDAQLSKPSAASNPSFFIPTI